MTTNDQDEIEITYQGPSTNKQRMIYRANDCKRTTLTDKLHLLLQPIYIQNYDYKKALELMRDLGDCVTLPNNNTNLYVGAYRNWYLELKNSTSNLLHLFVFSEDIKTSTKEPSIVKFVDRRDIFETFLFSKNFTPVRENENADDESPTSTKSDSRDLYGWQYRHNETGIKFAAASHPFLLCEFQRCRLINYYVTFDSRIIHLFGLVYFWMRANRIHLDEPKLDRYKLLYQIPDPGAMDMLLVTFLCQKKIIPCLSEIQEQPHEALYLESKRMDMGFNANPEYAEKWQREKSNWTQIADMNSDDYVLSIFLMLEEFFKFCVKLGTDPVNWVLNTRDGENLPRESFSNLRADPRKTKMSEREYLCFHNFLKKPEYCKRKINIIHPFVPTTVFSLAEDRFIKKICPMMKSTGERLINYVDQYRHDEADIQLYGDDWGITQLETLFKIT